MLRPLSNHWHRPLLFFHSAPEEIIGLDAPRSMCDDGKTRTTGRRRIYEHDSLCRDMYTVDAHARRHTQSLRPTTRSRTKKRITRRDNRIEEREKAQMRKNAALGNCFQRQPLRIVKSWRMQFRWIGRCNSLRYRPVAHLCRVPTQHKQVSTRALHLTHFEWINRRKGAGLEQKTLGRGEQFEGGRFRPESFVSNPSDDGQEGQYQTNCHRMTIGPRADERIGSVALRRHFALG